MFDKRLILTLALIVPLVACGGGGGGGGGDDGSSSSSSSGGGSGGGGGNSSNFNPDEDPVADAGANQNTIAGARVLLDGSASHDPNRDILSYQWQFTSRPEGSQATLTNKDTPAPSFNPDQTGQYKIQLTVNDGSNQSQPDTVTVQAVGTQADAPPVADAGRMQRVATGDTVQLDGSASTDIDSADLSYNWEIADRPSGSDAKLDDNTQVDPTFTADEPGRYRLRLRVRDDNSKSDDRVNIIAADGNVTPVANAGPNRRVPPRSTVELDGTDSSDANGDDLNYDWQFVYRPQGSSANLRNSQTATPTFKANVQGVYVVGLVVGDGDSQSAGDHVLINSRPRLDLLVGLSEVAPNKQGFLSAGLPFFQVFGKEIDLNQSGVVINRYRLTAAGQDYTVNQVEATKINDCDLDSTPSFDGLSNGTVIKQGESVTFTTVVDSGDQNGLCDLQYRFVVQESDDVFQAQDRVQIGPVKEPQ